MKKKNDLEMKEQNKLAVLKGWFWFLLEILPIWLFVIIVFMPGDILQFPSAFVPQDFTEGNYTTILNLYYDYLAGNNGIIGNSGLATLLNLNLNYDGIMNFLNDSYFSWFNIQFISNVFLELFDFLELDIDWFSGVFTLVILLSWYVFIELVHVFVDFILLLPNIVKKCMNKLGGC